MESQKTVKQKQALYRVAVLRNLDKFLRKYLLRSPLMGNLETPSATFPNENLPCFDFSGVSEVSSKKMLNKTAASELNEAETAIGRQVVSV